MGYNPILEHLYLFPLIIVYHWHHRSIDSALMLTLGVNGPSYDESTR